MIGAVDIYRTPKRDRNRRSSTKHHRFHPKLDRTSTLPSAWLGITTYTSRLTTCMQLPSEVDETGTTLTCLCNDQPKHNDSYLSQQIHCLVHTIGRYILFRGLSIHLLYLMYFSSYDSTSRDFGWQLPRTRLYRGCQAQLSRQHYDAEF